MTRETPALGLCTTCNHFPDCAFRTRAVRATWHCNEFDNGTPNGAMPPDCPPVPARSDPPPPPPAAAGAERGLCVNCEERNYCLRPKPPGGVWHCEEYR